MEEVMNEFAPTSDFSMKASPMSRKARAFSIQALLSPVDSASEDGDEVKGLGDAERDKVEQDSRSSPRSLSSETPLPSPPITEDLITEEKCRTSDNLGRSCCTLEMKELWKKFHDLGTEMIITKSGRRMFPSMRVSFSNLDPKANYQVFFDIVAVDSKRYRYAYHRSCWLVAGRADPPIPRKVYTHPDGPFRGDSLMKQSISFEKVKLTNNLHDKWGYIILNSMHKYLPRVHLVKYEDKVPKASFLSDLETHDRKVFTFEETQFIGVTAYQNQLITKLKIDSNPFAKGFRDSARITQIDRESVDLLIKASRQGYPAVPNPMSHALLTQLPQNPLPLMPSGFVCKYPPLLPMQQHQSMMPTPEQMSKDFLKLYFDRLSSNQCAVNGMHKALSTHNNIPRTNSVRFNPYKS